MGEEIEKKLMLSFFPVMFLSGCSQHLENIVLGVTSGARNGVWSEPWYAVDWEEIMGPGRVGTKEEQF